MISSPRLLEHRSDHSLLPCVPLIPNNNHMEQLNRLNVQPTAPSDINLAELAV